MELNNLRNTNYLILWKSQNVVAYKQNITKSHDINVKKVLNKEERDSAYFMPKLFNVYKIKQTLHSKE